MNNLSCPHCGLSHSKKNGHTYYGKQNYLCKNKTCGRQFVADAHYVSAETKALMSKLLLERLSLRGICRVTGVSLSWLLAFFVELYQKSPDDLHAQCYQGSGKVQCFRCEAEAAELWSFVSKQAEQRWVWLALDLATRQVVAFPVGDRDDKNASACWNKIPLFYRQTATFYTAGCHSYANVIPAAQHQVCAKGSGGTNTIERFNCTLRQRVSRLVRKSLSFSKNDDNHVGAIKYFICHYNLMVLSEL